jgi:hypothetical protein
MTSLFSENDTYLFYGINRISEGEKWKLEY